MLESVNKLLTFKILTTIFITDPASGTSSDWVYEKLKVPYVYLLELRQSLDAGSKLGFLVPPSDILATVEETYAGIMAAINAFDKDVINARAPVLKKVITDDHEL